ncbi:MAG: hypothetical protein PQJ58_11950 [Spirochaetales bacterium]|nr:hypothetical protein [Spirochaetales bacterium]
MLIVLIWTGCDGNSAGDDASGEGSGDGLTFDIRVLDDSSESSGFPAKAAYLPSAGNEWFTPDSFIIKVGTVAINDEEGNFLEILDFENDEDCIEIDLGAGESLSDQLTISIDYDSDFIAWIGFAILPEITYSYKKSGGTSHSGTLTLDVTTGGGFYYEIGGARGRTAFDIDLYEPDRGWGDTRLYFSDSAQNLTMFFDLDYIIRDSNEDGDPESIEYEKAFFTVTDGCSVNYYHFKNFGGSGSIYPYRLTMIETASGLPVYGKVFGRSMTSSGTTDYEIPELGSMSIDDHDSRDSCLTINTDGSYDIYLQNGTTIPGLTKDAVQSMTIGATDVYVLYEAVF